MINKTIKVLATASRVKLSPLSSFFSTEKKDPTKPPLIPVKVQVDSEVFQYAFPLHTKLSKNLQNVGVPLDFECGFSCSCGTCACTFEAKDFEKITNDQPIGETEKAVLRENSYGDNVRLTCQLFVMEYFRDMKIKASQQ